MAKPVLPQFVTANDLRSGEAVFLRADGTWSRDFAEVALWHGAEAAEAALARAAQPLVVVGPYLAEARETPQGPEPVHFREAFRTRGPSNYAHGKQEAR